MEVGETAYDNDVVMFVSDSNDSDLGADVEVRDEQQQQDSNSNVRLPEGINHAASRVIDFRHLDYYDYDVIEDPLHGEDVQLALLELISNRQEVDLNSDESDSSTQVYAVPNNDVEVHNDVETTSAPIPEKSPVKKLDTKTNHVDVSSDDDGMTCSICFDVWTCSGEHKLVSLRCGHLFGKKCINRWLKNRDAKCPQCNARARKSEIRPIYARTIKMLDTTERDYAIKELEKESESRKKAEMEVGRRKMECDMLRSDIEKLKHENMLLQLQLNNLRAGGKQPSKLTSHVSLPSFSAIQQLDMKSSGCRVIDCSSYLGVFAVTQPSTNPLFPGHGIRKITTSNLDLCEFIHVHHKPIKDISFRRDGCILTASLDKSVKLINCLSNSIVQNYTLDCDVWSCCWDEDNNNYFYAGVSSGGVYVFDLRMTDRWLGQLPNSGERSPVVSLQYLKSQQSANHSKCGPVIGQLGSCHFYERVHSQNTYTVNPLPLEGKFTSLSVESTTSHLLVSCRPSQKQPQVTHTLCELSCDVNKFSCNFLHTMTAGRTQAQLTRSKLMLHPDNDSTVLVCAGDEESKSTLIWNGCTGSLIDKLPAEAPILDIATFRWDKPVLATLSDKTIYFYNWNKV